jgi:hypothetical protein
MSEPMLAARIRFYDLAPPQFISRDPMVMVTRSAYGYVGGNPLNRSDPTGLFDLPFGLCGRNPFGGDNDNGGCHTTFSDRQAVGLSLGVVAAGTGAGAIFAGSTGAALGLGGASFLTGAGAAGLDEGPCRQGDSSACVGLYLGAGGALGSAFGVGAFAAGASKAITEAFGISGLSLGVAATTWDLLGAIYSHATACKS